jgi:hypothetical protein
MITDESSSYQAFHSFYEEIQSEFPISVTTKNLFLSQAESIAQSPNLTVYYVCEGDYWLWEAKELNPQEPFNEIWLVVLILCAGHHPAFFLLAPPQTRRKIRSLHI